MSALALAVVGAAGSAYGAKKNSASQAAANEANIQLARENRQWEEGMANTAIQRRKADLIAAGGNPALAFTTGDGATTPTVQPARVESEQRGEAYKQFTNTAMQAAQLQNMQANTVLTLNSARKAAVEANNAEQYGSFNAATQRSLLIAKLEGAEIDNKRREIAKDLSGRQLAKFNETFDAMVAMAKQQAQAGQIDLNALRTLATASGLDAGMFQPVLDYISSYMIKKR